MKGPDSQSLRTDPVFGVSALKGAYLQRYKVYHILRRQQTSKGFGEDRLQGASTVRSRPQRKDRDRGSDQPNRPGCRS